MSLLLSMERLSLPSRERGSKRLHRAIGGERHGRSPRGSADRNRPISPAPRYPTWSLPSRERGSKLYRSSSAWTRLRSLPSRERGSKRFDHRDSRRPRERSLPSRERGSKLLEQRE